MVANTTDIIRDELCLDIATFKGLIVRPFPVRSMKGFLLRPFGAHPSHRAVGHRSETVGIICCRLQEIFRMGSPSQDHCNDTSLLVLR